MTVLDPTRFTAKTILGMSREMELAMGLTPANTTQYSLNHKYGVEASTVPSQGTKLAYFGIGIGGCRNIDDGNLSEPNVVRLTNMDLYTPVPIRMVAVEEDLTDSERALYRMRRLEEHSGQIYACYYLKLIDLDTVTVQYTQVNPDTGAESPYTLNNSNLNPTPPIPDSSGNITDESRNINVFVNTRLVFTGAELSEYIGVVHGGDTRYARISEIGLYLGRDQTVAGTQINNVSGNYTESLMTVLHTHATMNGYDLASPTASITHTVVLGKSDIILV